MNSKLKWVLMHNKWGFVREQIFKHNGDWYSVYNSMPVVESVDDLTGVTYYYITEPKG